MNTWFTSDTHFGHANIIKYCNRSFRDIDHMNKSLIRNWNERVKKDDLVIFLGDFCFRNTAGGKQGEGEITVANQYKEKLNGNIVFVRGNHDDNNTLNTKITGLVMEIGGHEVYCVHNPSDFDANWKINLCGHVHEAWKIKTIGTGITKTYLINVGVDVWKYRPINISEVFKALGQYKRYETVECKSKANV
jgi:calcineurin-like phosphoesterase family protein